MSIKNLSLICAAFNLSTDEPTEGDYYRFLSDEKILVNIDCADVAAEGRCLADSACATA